MPISLNPRMGGGASYMNRPMGGQGFMNKPTNAPSYINAPKGPKPSSPLNLGQPRANPVPKTTPAQQPTFAPGMEAWLKNEKARANQPAKAPTSVLQNKPQLDWNNSWLKFDQQLRQNAPPGKFMPDLPLPYLPDLPPEHQLEREWRQWQQQQFQRNPNWNQNPIPPGQVPPKFNKFLGNAGPPVYMDPRATGVLAPHVLDGLYT